MNAYPHATLQPADFHLITHNPKTPTYLHTYMEKKMENGMLRMKSRELEVGGWSSVTAGGGVERAEVGEEQKEGGGTKES